MSVTEIILLIAGAAVLLAGYILPVKKEEKNETVPQIDEKQIKILVEAEVDDARAQIRDVVEETVTYSVEKTERAMERLTNEKIMAVNEYSDTVLETINKNHKEAVFLYDMLNEKHDELVKTVGQATQAAAQIRQTADKTDIPEQRSTDLSVKQQADIAPAQAEEEQLLSAEDDFIPLAPEKVINIIPDIEIDSANREENNNEKILSLHKLGKSKTAIARELGLGVGEVKLVIDLFESE